MDPKTPTEIADTAAEAIRSLNHATLRHLDPREGWEFPADAYSVVGNLQAMAARLPQLLQQVERFVQQLADGDHIRSDKGGNGADDVAAAIDALTRASADAVAMTAALDTAHSALSPLAYKS